MAQKELAHPAQRLQPNRQGIVNSSHGAVKPFARCRRQLVRMLNELPESRWNFATAAHLLNRAGFGGTPDQIVEFARLAPAAAVDRLLDYPTDAPTETTAAWSKVEPDRAERLRAFRQAGEEERKKLVRERNRTQREQMVGLLHWWLQRMATGPHPLQEKLTLFWHGHFATSVLKVKEPYLMWRQNDLFRRHGAGRWENLLTEVTRDPAMLIWLDQAQSKAGHPNENYARELMELFALGEGHYSETDVTEAARALTGLTLDRVKLEPIERRRLHDAGTKTLLGQTGRFTADDGVRLVANHPQSGRFLTAKLWNFFAGSPPAPALNEALAAVFAQHRGAIRPVLRTLLLSEAFHAPEVVRQQIKSPVQLLVQACRQLERPLPPPLVCVQIQRSLGQELFNPPNVKGWDGGVAWINTNTLLNRHNLALMLVTGENSLPLNLGKNAKPEQQRRLERLQRRVRSEGVAVDRILPPAAAARPEALLAAIEHRLLNGPLSERRRARLRDYLKAQGALDEQDLRGLLRLAMCTPEYQLT
jgi:uncharacterized protein (DUF1800 family)